MFLDQIVAVKQQEVEQLAARFSLAESERRIAQLPACRGFRKSLQLKKLGRMGLIAEVKKASPSKGLIRADFDPLSIAKAYESAGANCVSVLTDKSFFKGNDDYLSQIHHALQIPILRKDFTIDYRQIYEARLIGADAVLLIVAILSMEQLKQFSELIKGLGMDALMEVHDRQELDCALQLDTPIIGVNNRNLRSFQTNLKTTEELIRHIPKDKTIISESGISTPEEIGYLSSLGVDAVLVGECFMRQKDVSQAVQDLMKEKFS